MESGERPDLFDVKFLRDELLFYSRDENQFLRRRRAFVFALYPDLTATRFKDPDLPYQRGVLLLALLTTAVKRLTEWLSADALTFDVLFVGGGGAAPLAAERDLLRTLLREPIANGDGASGGRAGRGSGGVLRGAGAAQPVPAALLVAVDPPTLEARDVEFRAMRIDGPQPVLVGADAEEGDDAFDAWPAALWRLLQGWV